MRLRGLQGFSAAIAAEGIGSPWDETIAALAGGDSTLITLTKAIIARESEWNPHARNPADPSVGLMQILVGPDGPAPGETADALLDPTTNLTVGINYLESLLGQYSLADAVSAYNAGAPTSANASYVADVLAYYQWYATHDPLVEQQAGQPVAASEGGTSLFAGVSLWVVGALAVLGLLAVSQS